MAQHRLTYPSGTEAPDGVMVAPLLRCTMTLWFYATLIIFVDNILQYGNLQSTHNTHKA